MITIKIGGQPLYIPKDTALVLEQSNNVFDNDGYMDDVVWTFEVPAEQNQKVLGAVQYVYTGGRKRYDCELSIDGVPFSRGILYVQTATDAKRVSCGIVTNSFTLGFGDKMLRENDYGQDIVISQSEQGHQSGWLNFLQGSLNKESVYKFFLFADESFYKNNEDFGYHRNAISGLLDNAREDQFCKYVNRLFFDDGGNIYNNPDTRNGSIVRQGVRIFNSSSNGKRNGYCFCPAIRLDWIVRKVAENAGLAAQGSFFTDKTIHSLFSQSMNAMDGDVFQYGTRTIINVGGNVTPMTAHVQNDQKFSIDHSNEMYESFGWISNVSFGFRLLLPIDELVFNDRSSGDYNISEYGGERLDEIYALAIGTSDCTLPTIRMIDGANEADGTSSFRYGSFPTLSEIKEQLPQGLQPGFTIDRMTLMSHGELYVQATCDTYDASGMVNFVQSTECQLIQLTKSASKNVFFSGTLGGYTEGTVTPLYNDIPATTPQFIRLVKLRVLTSNEARIRVKLPDGNAMYLYTQNRYGSLEYLTDYEVIASQDVDTTDTPLNIFSNMLKWRDHMPNLSNGEFLSLMCRLFGLNMYANPMTHELQLSFFKDVMQANSFDISEWVSTEEREEYQPKEYEVSITTTLATKSVSENNIIESKTNVESLPAPMLCKNKHAYVLGEKAYRRSTIIKDTSRYRWEQAGGDNRKLVDGASDAEEREEVSIEANIPNMRIIDEEIEKSKKICEINVSGNSQLLDEDYNGEFDFILQQYMGKRVIVLPGASNVAVANIEEANPSAYPFGGYIYLNHNYIDLSASGQNSLGEKWLQPLYKFLGSHEVYRFTAHLPVWAFSKVYALLKPQEGCPAEQVRWIQVRGNRYLPIKMSFEFGAGDTVIATIECAAPHYDV